MRKDISRMQRAFTVFVLLLLSVVILLFSLEVLNVGPRRLKFKSHYGSHSLTDQPRKAKLHYQGSNRKESYQELKQMDGSIQNRKNMLIKQCDQLQQNGSEFHTSQNAKLDHIIVNDKHRVLYCFVPKVACSNLKRIFLLLTGKINKTDPLEIQHTEVHATPSRYFTYLHTLSVESIQHRLKNYTKVLFVREPLVRILSAYRDKFMQGENYFTQHYGRQVIKLFRKNSSQHSIQKGQPVKFSEFIDYILYVKAHSQKLEAHWDTYFNLCSPCHIHYDFIGKFENLEEDVNLLLKEIEANQLVRFPKREEIYTANKTEDVLEKFYRLIDPQKIIQLQDVYRLDYFLFGYQMPEAIKKLIGASK